MPDNTKAADEGVRAQLDWSLYVQCPQCQESFDLVEHDHEHGIAKLIFTNAWDRLKGYEITCPACEHETTIEKVEY